MAWTRPVLAAWIVVILVAGTAWAQPEVIRHPDPEAPLAARWAWALEEVRQRGLGDTYWIGYGIERLMEAQAHIGSWRSRRQGPSLRALIEGTAADWATSEQDAARRALDRSSDRNRPRRLEQKTIALLFRIDPRQGTIQAVEISDLDLHVDLQERPLFWLGPSGDAPSLAWLEERYEAAASADVREDLVGAIGLHDDTARVAVLLSRILQGPDDADVREQAAFWLGQTDEPEALRVLRAVAQADRSRDVREQAVFGLSQMARPEALEAIIDLARGADDREVREKAVFWLGQAASERATAVLQDVVADGDDVEVQKQALFALAERPGGSGIPALIDVARTHPNPALRKQAIFWLGESGDPRALEVLIQLARGGS